jgi:uncharacterized protein YndB with AHSA1/START domain
MTTPAPNGKAVTTKKIFSRETAVRVEIQSDASILWALLTNASDFARWNSTIVYLEGEIKQGGKIRLTSTLDPKRVFKLTVKQAMPEERLVWGDAMGTRVFELGKSGKGATHFTMTEKIGGPIFPLIARMIPPFDQSFEQFASDLKREAEAISKTK